MGAPVVTIEGGPAFPVPDDEPNLLRAALRAGVGFPHECGVGGCGSCRFELKGGEVATLWDAAPGLSEKERKRGKRLACQSRPLTDCTIKVRTGAEYVPRIRPSQQRAELVERRWLTADMALLGLRAPTPAEFLPGQFALLALPDTPGARAYSMCNAANAQGRWDFIVKRVPGGKGSTALLDRLQPGDAVGLDGPFGLAYWRPAPREAVCVAGGSGLAPMLAVARAALTDGQGPVHFFHGVRTPADLCAGPFLEALPGARERLRYVPVVSEPVPAEAWAGARGFVHQALAAGLAQGLDAYEHYFAGPPPMVNALQELLMGARVPPERLHFDRFL